MDCEAKMVVYEGQLCSSLLSPSAVMFVSLCCAEHFADFFLEILSKIHKNINSGEKTEYKNFKHSSGKKSKRVTLYILNDR